MTYLHAGGLSKSFGTGPARRHVLQDVSVSMTRGEFVSIVGAMGSGKSTLLGVLAGLLAPDTGRVVIDGEPVRELRRDAAYVFQNYSLLPWLTALENVRLAVGSTFPSLPARRRREEAANALEQVGLGHALHRRPRQLSGGMRQRVSLARALVTRPSILFLDEPFGALDAITRETLQQELARLCATPDRPLTVVMITNNIDEALLLSDRILPLLPGPPSTLGTPIPVALPRPRTVAHLALDERAGGVRAHVVTALVAAVRGRLHGASRIQDRAS